MDLQTLKDKIKSLNFKNHADIRAAAALSGILEGIVSAIPTDTPSFEGSDPRSPLSTAEADAVLAAPWIKVGNGVLPRLNCLTGLQETAIHDYVYNNVDQDPISIASCFGQFTWSTEDNQFLAAAIFVIYKDADGYYYSSEVDI